MVIPRVGAQPAMDAFGQVAVGVSDLTKSFGFYYAGVSLATGLKVKVKKLRTKNAYLYR